MAGLDEVDDLLRRLERLSTPSHAAFKQRQHPSYAVHSPAAQPPVRKRACVWIPPTPSPVHARRQRLWNTPPARVATVLATETPQESRPTQVDQPYVHHEPPPAHSKSSSTTPQACQRVDLYTDFMSPELVTARDFPAKTPLHHSSSGAMLDLLFQLVLPQRRVQEQRVSLSPAATPPPRPLGVIPPTQWDEATQNGDSKDAQRSNCSTYSSPPPREDEHAGLNCVSPPWMCQGGRHSLGIDENAQGSDYGSWDLSRSFLSSSPSPSPSPSPARRRRTRGTITQKQKRHQQEQKQQQQESTMPRWRYKRTTSKSMNQSEADRVWTAVFGQCPQEQKEQELEQEQEQEQELEPVGVLDVSDVRSPPSRRPQKTSSLAFRLPPSRVQQKKSSRTGTSGVRRNRRGKTTTGRTADMREFYPPLTLS